MALWTMYDGKLRRACLVDSVSETAFGPLFADEEECEDFLEWLGHDPRKHTTTDLVNLKNKWLKEQEKAKS